MSEYTMTSFVKDLDTKLTFLSDLKLPYLTMNPKSGSSNLLSFSGWLSRNWLAFSRISKWAMSHLSFSLVNKDEAPKYSYPNLYHKYQPQHILSWCRSRGISTRDLPRTCDTSLKVKWFLNLTKNYTKMFQHYTRSDLSLIHI